MSSESKLKRNQSASPLSLANDDDDLETVPENQLSILDILDDLSLVVEPVRDELRRQGDLIKGFTLRQRDKVDKVRGNILNDRDIDKFKLLVTNRVRRLDEKLSESKIATTTEKVNFSAGLLNILSTGYLIGHYPEYFHIYYTTQLVALMPIRFYTYRKKSYQYFLADLCYYANLLLVLYLYVFPNSRRLFIAVFCLSYGSLSWAVVTWRNSLVLHSLEKSTSSFIHIYPPTVLHCILHSVSPEFRQKRFPGAYANGNRLNLMEAVIWASLAYGIWQLLYYIFILVGKREKIKAGCMTSFEWLRRSWSNTPIGKFVNKLPEKLAIIAFMLIQFFYQLLTMLPCPIWFRFSSLSGLFLVSIFTIAAYNGANYYIEVFGKRFQKELLKLQAKVAEYQGDDKNNFFGSGDGAKSTPNLVPPKPTITHSETSLNSLTTDDHEDSNSDTNQTDGKEEPKSSSASSNGKEEPNSPSTPGDEKTKEIHNSHDKVIKNGLDSESPISSQPSPSSPQAAQVNGNHESQAPSNEHHSMLLS